MINMLKVSINYTRAMAVDIAVMFLLLSLNLLNSWSIIFILIVIV